MTEITRVPIQPVAKGSLTKLWIGVILAIAIGAGLAWAAVPRGLNVDTITAGTGPMPQDGDVLFIKYKGTLAADGTVFDESRDIPLPVEGIFPEGTPFPIEEGATQFPALFPEGLKQMPERRVVDYESTVSRAPSSKWTEPYQGHYGPNRPRRADSAQSRSRIRNRGVVDVMSQQTFENAILRPIRQQAMQGQMGEGGGRSRPGGPAGAPPVCARGGGAGPVRAQNMSVDQGNRPPRSAFAGTHPHGRCRASTAWCPEMNGILRMGRNSLGEV